MSHDSYIVVNADDFGMVQSATDGILRGHREGVITSTSIVTTTAGFTYARDRLSECPGLGVGLHFSLSEGRSLSCQNSDSMLTHSNGTLKWRFFPLLFAMRRPLAKQLLIEIEKELDAQINKALDAGITLDHINGERHIHLIPGISELVQAAAKRYSIPYIRQMTNDVGFSYSRASDLPLYIANAGPLKFALLKHLSGKSLPVGQRPDNALSANYCSMLYTGKMDRVLSRIWAAPPPGITELAVHPGDFGAQMLPEVADKSLQNYLRHGDRERELMACIEIKSTPTTANLVSYGDLL
jgi:YdjC-like protein